MKLDTVIDYLLDRVTDPVPRYILFKEILPHPESSDQCKDMYDNIMSSKWYLQLKSEQWPDGTWGRFHTQDTKSVRKQKFVTTEAALRRMRELSLDSNDPMAAACLHRMEEYLKGSDLWPDRIEKHYGFVIALNTIVAANLSLFDPDNPLIQHKRKVCAENITKAFQNGVFIEDIWEAENHRCNEILLRAYMVHPVWLLQNNPYLSEDIQRKYLGYLWTRKEGIYYISGSAPAAMAPIGSRRFYEWLANLEAISGFSLFPEFMREGAAEQLLDDAYRLMNHEVALAPSHPIYGHYSESWRNNTARNYDMLLRILRVLIRCNETVNI